ncbi:MAG: hypothetical protein ACI86S_000053 [Paracoccaceae bacterium]|jgi:hypothetical protein
MNPLFSIPTLALGLTVASASPDRQIIMRGALLVACVDGQFQKAKHRAISHLAHALVIPAPQIVSMVRDFAGLLRTPVAAAPA